MFIKLKKIYKSKLFKGSAVILIATSIGNLLNYLYHFVTGRMLSPAEYGLLQSLISLTYFQSIFIGAFRSAAVEKIGSSDNQKLYGVISGLKKLAIKTGIIYWLITLVLYPLINKLLHLDNQCLYLIFSMQSLLAFLPVVYSSTLEARLEFSKAALTSVLSTLSKLVSAVIFLSVGLGVIGGLSSWLVLKIISLTLSFFLVKNLISKQRKGSLIKVDLSFLKFSLLSLVVNLSIISLYTTDIIFARHYLNQHQAGLYAATSNLGKVIFFGATTILSVSFPMFVRYRVKRHKLIEILKLSLIFSLLCAAAGLIAYSLFPQLAIRLLYGSRYLQSKEYLLYFAVFISILAVFNLLIRFLLALKSKLSAQISFFAAVLQIILILANHKSVPSIITSSLIAVLIGLVVSSIVVLKSIHEFANGQIVSDCSGL